MYLSTSLDTAVCVSIWDNISPQMNTDVLVRVYAAKAFIWRIKNPQGRLCPLGCTANADDLLA